MAPKRRNGESDEVSGRERKKVKIAAARTIAVQNTTSSGGTKASSSAPQPVAGPSKIPSIIDVEKFVDARAFEITAMHAAMKNACASSTHRVWQTLPRHLRRRAASHDVRRVPERLRDRAQAEMDVVRKKALDRSMPKRGKANRPLATESFLKRQRDKTWLETHIWHAKRMHMENMWGYRLAVQPTEKAYRPSHRATIHDAILHDASYYALTEVIGPELLLKSMLDRACDPLKARPSSQRYTPGARILNTHIYKLGSYPLGLISPATVMWKPVPLPTVPTEPTKAIILNQGKGDEKEKAPIKRSSSTDPFRMRSAWVRVHPSAYEEVLKILQQAASQTLVDHQQRNANSEELNLDLIDLRGHVNIYEIMGPKSCQVLKGVLKPVSSDKRADFKDFWNSLGDLQSSASLARGMIIGFKVNDPRLSFPPKNAKPRKQLPSQKLTFPSAQLAESELWEEGARRNLATPTFSKKQLDDRRSKNIIPGGSLQNLRQDDRIPVMLIQRSLEAQGSQAIHGWTFIVPAGWSMTFWSSLVYTGTRVGGQRERQTQAYEAGTIYFPRDYPVTPSYEEWATRRESEEKGKWEKKPPAKRVNFKILCTEHPWKANWLGVLGIGNAKTAHQDESFTTAQREPLSMQDATTSNPSQVVEPWLLQGPETPKIVSNLSSAFNKSGMLVSELNRLLHKKGLDPLTKEINSEVLLQGALVNIRVEMCSRGTPEDLAMVYRLDDIVVKQWQKVLRLKQPGGPSDEDTPEETTLANEVPPRHSIIGYVTTGHFSLSRGHGYGIGAIPLTRLLEVEHQRQRYVFLFDTLRNTQFDTSKTASKRNHEIENHSWNKENRWNAVQGSVCRNHTC
ncbi:POP1-domain-containing protein [Crepidotus variabilis]|uniref:POP1-domain-containing protein n=1 Tax=Crepidotus variabilis TaxID=179855 RepID=A0A9P6EEG4_9AGAR|nr:POP1-domain-containing protein [Crepidotus variabilis]